MSRPKKILVIAAASLVGLLLVLVAAAIIVLQTSWFANFLREKVISAVQDSTGAVVEIGSVQVDLSHLTLRVRNVVAHGTEPKTVAPLLRADLLELRLKLFTGLYHLVDLKYLGIEHPQANLMVFPDGTTNLPHPKVASPPSNTSGLQTMVDLAVGQFQLDNGLVQVAQQKTAFNARGENLQLQLLYNALHPGYKGTLKIDPLLLNAGDRPPLQVHVDLPLALEGDAVHLTGGQLSTGQSKVAITASIDHLASPNMLARLNASISLPELQRSFALPLDTSAPGSPKTLNANLALQMKNDNIEVQTAHLDLGSSTFDASGPLRNSSNTGKARFHATLKLAQLSPLFKLTSPETSGDIALQGTARLDAKFNYFVDGTLNSRDLALRSGATRISDLSLSTPFHVDPYLIRLDGLRLNAFGGTLASKIFVENMRQVSVEAHLRKFVLATVCRAIAGNRLGYGGILSGDLNGAGDLQAKGTTGYSATARLAITPTHAGIPVDGRIAADYSGKTGIVSLHRSYLAFPHSRLDLAGSLNKRIDVQLVTHNLNDFLPAAALASPGQPITELPIALHNGIASLQAQITGNLSAPHIESQVSIDRFALEHRPFDHLGLHLAASPTGAGISNGVLSRKTLAANFDAAIGLRKWSPLPSSPLTANVTLRNGNMSDVMSLADSTIPATGAIAADVHIKGTYGNPLGYAALQVVDGSIDNQPFDRINARADLADRLITLSNLEIAEGDARISARGTFAHPADSFSTGHLQLHLQTANLQLSNLQVLQRDNAGIAGLVELTADAAADLREVNNQSSIQLDNVNADLAASGLRVQNQDAGQLTASARTVNGNVKYRIASDFAGSNIRLNGHTALTGQYATVADASIQNLAVEKLLGIMGQAAVPARGTLSADAHLSGTMNQPKANLNFALNNASIYGEPLSHLRGVVQYSNTAVTIPSLELTAPAGTLALSGSFNHPANNFQAGTIALHVDDTNLQLGKVEHVQQLRPGTAGVLHLAADLSAKLQQQNGKPEVLFSKLNADLAAKSLRMNDRNLGALQFTANTSGQNLRFKLDSNIAQSQVHGSGTARLTGDFPVDAKLSFANIRYENIAPFIAADPEIRPSFDALIEGTASANGPLLNTDDLTAELRLDRVEAQTSRLNSPTGGASGRSVAFQNKGAIIVRLNHSAVQIAQLHMEGRSTTLNAAGFINFKDAKAPLHVDVDANADLGVLQDINRDFFSSGNVALNTSVRGSFDQPLVNGRIVLKNANVNYADAPNGLSNGNGIILLNGTSATIQTLTGESGGGKIAVTGFAGLTGQAITYNLRATAANVRVRYSGISIVSNATLGLTGNTKHSLATGRITIQRIAYASTSDIGSILSSASVPAPAPSTPSGIIAGMKLEIQITTAPELRVVSEYTQRLQVEANLTIRGTAADPGIIGRISVTDGQLVFFGNQYTVNQGTINFYNPNAIEPVLNVSLETNAQGVNVNLGVSGPIDNLKLSYRSDPPLTFEQIVSLLATNTTPNDPSIAAHQPTSAQQSVAQMGESAVLGQAVANPIASRVKRVFGLSQFKVDPAFTGNGGVPTARVTLQEQIASNITFTYINDISQPNAQIVRVEWALTPKFSAVALRDYNGVVSLEFFYKFKVR